MQAEFEAMQKLTRELIEKNRRRDDNLPKLLVPPAEPTSSMLMRSTFDNH